MPKKLYFRGSLVLEDPSPNPDYLLRGMLDVMLDEDIEQNGKVLSYERSRLLFLQLSKEEHWMRVESPLWANREQRPKNTQTALGWWVKWFEQTYLSANQKLVYNQRLGWYQVVEAGYDDC